MFSQVLLQFLTLHQALLSEPQLIQGRLLLALSSNEVGSVRLLFATSLLATI